MYWRQSDPSDRISDSPLYKKYKKILHTARKIGIRHFDTAQGYGNGISEQITGQSLKVRRTGVSIATKTYYRPPDTVRKGIEKSLSRLQSDYIDIFYLHWPKPDRDLRPHIEALEAARQAGLIRHIGVSNFRPEQISPLLEAGQIDFCQFAYSLIWRTAERELVPFCREKGIRMVSYSSLAQGILAHPPGWLSSLEPSDPRKKLIPAAPHVRPRVERIVGELESLAEDLAVTIPQLSLAWNLHRRGFRYILFGARTEEQLRESYQASRISLPTKTLQQLDALTAPLAELFSEEDNIFGHRP